MSQNVRSVALFLLSCQLLACAGEDFSVRNDGNVGGNSGAYSGKGGVSGSGHTGSRAGFSGAGAAGVGGAGVGGVGFGGNGGASAGFSGAGAAGVGGAGVGGVGTGGNGGDVGNAGKAGMSGSSGSAGVGGAVSSCDGIMCGANQHCELVNSQPKCIDDSTTGGSAGMAGSAGAAGDAGFAGISGEAGAAGTAGAGGSPSDPCEGVGIGTSCGDADRPTCFKCGGLTCGCDGIFHNHNSLANTGCPGGQPPNACN